MKNIILSLSLLISTLAGMAQQATVIDSKSMTLPPVPTEDIFCRIEMITIFKY